MTPHLLSAFNPFFASLLFLSLSLSVCYLFVADGNEKKKIQVVDKKW